jgi:hypothetical protein
MGSKWNLNLENKKGWGLIYIIIGLLKERELVVLAHPQMMKHSGR